MESGAATTNPFAGMPALDLHGQLQIVRDADSIQLRADGRHLVVDATSLAILREVLRSLPADTTAITDALIAHHALTLEIQVNGTQIARLGEGAQPNWSGTLAGIPTAQLSLGGLLRAILR